MTDTQPQPTRRSVPPIPVCESCGGLIFMEGNTKRLRDEKGHFTGKCRHHVCPEPASTFRPMSGRFDIPPSPMPPRYHAKPKRKTDWTSITVIAICIVVLAALGVAEGWVPL
jgi:hypothetical protein